MAKKKQASNKPTSVKLTRDGNKFTLSWTSHGEYSVIKFKYRMYQSNGGAQGWSEVEELSNPSQRKEKKFNIDLSKFFPTSGKPTLLKVEALISVKNKDTSKIEYTHVTANAFYIFTVPKDPAAGAITADTTSTGFAYSVEHTGATEVSQFKQLVYNFGVKDNWGTKDPKDFTEWGTQYSTLNASGTLTNTSIGTTTVTGTQSKTAMIRMRSQGVCGNSPNWVYNKIVYAYPNAVNASTINGTATNRSTGCDVIVHWTKNENDLHPVTQNKVDYYIGKPINASLAPPAGASFETGLDWTDKKAANAQDAQFYIDTRPGAEECLWVRVWQKNIGNEITASDAVCIRWNLNPAKPEINSISYNAATNALAVSVTNNSELPNVTLTTEFVSNGTIIWSATGANPHGTVDLGSRLYNVRTRATCVTTKGAGASAYDTMQFDPTLECTNPTRYYPTNVKASAGTTAGSVAVSWTNVMRGVEKAYIVVADSPSNFGDPEKTVEISGLNPTSGIVTGLQYNVQWYFKVYTTNDAGDSGLSASYGSYKIPLDQVPAPNITLSETNDVNHDVIVSWQWNSNAEEIEILWDTDPNVGDSNNAGDAEGSITIERNNRIGNDSYVIKGLEWNKTWHVWARFGKDDVWTKKTHKQYTLTVNIPYPTSITPTRSPKVTDNEGETTVMLTWNCECKEATGYKIEWSSDYYARSNSAGASSTEVSADKQYVYISGLTLGKTWYFWVTTLAGDYSSLTVGTPSSIDLRTYPAKPSVTLSASDVYLYGRTDLSWTYSCEDNSEYKNAVIYIDGTPKIAVNDVQYYAIYPNEIGLNANTDYQVQVRVYSKNGLYSDLSQTLSFHITGKPTAAITNTSLVTRYIGDDPLDLQEVTALAELPLSITVSGIQNNGYATVYIERSKTVFLEKPDESIGHGYEGELVTLKNTNPDGTVTFDMNDLRMPFENMSEYRIIATVTDKYGTSDPATLEFVCLWDWHALMPEGSLILDYNDYVAKITVDELEYEEEGDGEGDYIDIYRLSADKPELIVHQAEFDKTYVDPYPALGENCGYRLVYVTAEGDYITDDNRLAWLDLEPETPLNNDRALIDFDSKRVECYYNVDVSNSWAKDFIETKYLGGSIQGDWNPGVSRSASLDTVKVTILDADSIDTMRRLAVYTGACHIRTPDGSSFSADIQVNSENSSHDKRRLVMSYGLAITRIDPDGFEGVLMEEYYGVE